jgi:hypothetical protein
MLMFSMSFSHLNGIAFDPTSLQNLVIITYIVTVPIAVLALFGNDGHRTDNNTSVDRRRKRRTNGVTV